jgi:hypothetical protein
MLLIDYSSAFNIKVPYKLIIKFEALGLNPALCNWVLDFLTGRPQVAGQQPPEPLLVHPLSPRRRGLYRCIKAGTKILKNSLYLKAIRLLNSNHEHIRGCCLYK